MKVISSEKKPIKMWLDEIEDSALQQAKNLANLPFIHSHVAIMPDSHAGYGMPIGGVIATTGVVIPNAVGVDIGCGMCALKTPLTEISRDELKSIMGEIRKLVPVGFNHQSEKQDSLLMPDKTIIGSEMPVIAKEYNSALYQLGTLGGGNHFIEIQKGDDGHIWIMIHSGSRNLGKKVADHYNKIAKDINAKWYSEVPKEFGLAFLPVDTEEGLSYIAEMKYCADFAFANRKLMMDRICEAFNINGFEIDSSGMINIAHNYTRLEHHFGKNVWIHRKGATSATLGEIGIIPSSQGTPSYIVEGLGNEQSFMSCSHGAGRTMSRTKARNELDLQSEIDKMGDVIHGIRNASDLDEAPSVYKNIDIVMENQKDLVKPIVKLYPLAVIKG